MEDPSHSLSDSTITGNSSKSNASECQEAEMKENTYRQVHGSRQPGTRHRSAGKRDVFERNYQYAFVYQEHKNAQVEKKAADEASLRHFKAQPLPISSPPRSKTGRLKFTVPITPEVLKHNLRKRKVADKN